MIRRCFILLSCLSIFVPVVKATSFLPLQSSDTWTLVSTNSDARTITCTPLSNQTFLVTGLFDAPVFLREAPGKGSNVQMSATGRAPWKPLFVFGREVDRSWRLALAHGHCQTVRAEWLDKGVQLSTPAGLFTGCLIWQCSRLPATANNCPDPSVTDLWLAPGEGPVGIKLSNNELFLLSTTSPIAPVMTNGLAATLTADQPSYTNVSGGAVVCPDCVTNIPPCEIACYALNSVTATAKFEFVVANISPNPITFTVTGQQFDIQLIDTNGEVVAAWSDGKAFPLYVAMETLAPGSNWTFNASMALHDRATNQLSGVYTARAFLTNIGEPAGVEASTQIRVIRLLTP